jgi:4a-hydroxytetrahydrobiopterin dehydratase
MVMAKLTDSELSTALQRLDGWQGGSAGITRTFEFKDFVQAIAFVNRLAQAAEAANHHPDIDIRYNKVSLTLVTHDEGGVSRKDIELAGKAGGVAGA